MTMSDSRSEPPPIPEEDRSAILQALTEYQRGFSGHRPEVAQCSYHERCSFIDEQGVTLLASRAQIEAFLSSIIKKLQARQWSHSEWIEIFIRPMDQDIAIVSTLAARYKTDGSELERVGGTYAFRKTEDGWKIAMTLSHPPERVLRFRDEH